MAVTAGGENLRLQAGETYKAGISAFCYLEDEDGDGTPDSLPVESAEEQSAGVFLPAATYPMLTYSPVPPSGGDTIKLLSVSGETEITVSSDTQATSLYAHGTLRGFGSGLAGTMLTFENRSLKSRGISKSPPRSAGGQNDGVSRLLTDNTAPLITLDSGPSRRPQYRPVRHRITVSGAE
jgi:hypothetical protein